MIVVIAGSRTIESRAAVERAIKGSGFEITEVLSGGARGVDTIGEKWARENDVPVRIFPAEWGVHGKGAGVIRNVEMCRSAEALIALHDGKSRGTAHCIEAAKKCGIKIYVADCKGNSR